MQADAVSEVVTCIEYRYRSQLSPSYFVAIAAVELGFFKQEGIEIEFIHNTKEGPELMREGKLDFIAGPAFAGTRAFPPGKG